jgi:excisionase family DNA binding protein
MDPISTHHDRFSVIMPGVPPAALYNLTPKEVGAQLGYHEDTIKRWADQGKILCFRTPGGRRRFRQADVDRFLEQSTAAPKKQAAS